MSGIERQPPEWAPHDSVWIGFPSHAELWEDDLAPARAEVIAFAGAVHAGGAGEAVRLVAANAEAAAAARAAVSPGIAVEHAPFGDIWLRDTGPIIVSDGAHRSARAFIFNGWGEKYRLEGDDDLALRLAQSGGFGEARRCKYVLEGGAIDVDGTGLAVTTEQCLLNLNRNPDLSKAEIEARLRGDLGLDRILWLGDGLLNDHTDGHVDNLARFVGEGRIAIPEPASPDDPNAAVYRDARDRARAFGLEVVPLPSPGRVYRDGEIIPASYMNFYIGNAAVVVPLYGASNDAAAIVAIQSLFPSRKVVGFRADHILTGGGSFHCISQQVPSLQEPA
jgi:agmatine deiminase